jgi:ElaB/YqjD/DUF883 family membrane-anchored ribosome-binding protein
MVFLNREPGGGSFVGRPQAIPQTKGIMSDRTTAKELTPTELASELRALLAEAEKILGDNAATSSHVAVAGLQERLEAAQEQLRELCTTTKQKVVSGAKQVDHCIRTHPYQSLAVALGVGVLVGVLTGRRDN